MLGTSRRTVPWATLARVLAVVAALAIVVTGVVLVRARPAVTVESAMSPAAAGARMRNLLRSAFSYRVEQRTTVTGTRDAAQQGVRVATAQFNGSAERDDDVFEAFSLDYLGPDGRPIPDRAMRLLWLKDQSVLMKMPGQPGRLGQQWFRYPDEDEDRYSRSGSPVDVWNATGSVNSWYALDDFVGLDFGPAHPDRALSLTGSISARAGVLTLGIGRARFRDQSAIDQLSGRAVVHVEIGADRRLQSLEIRGSEVDLGDPGQFSADWIDGVRHTVVQTTFSRYNAPITEVSPRQDQIDSITTISQAEMAKMLRPYSNLFVKVSV